MEEFEQDIEESRWKKYLIRLLGVFLIFLMISLTFASPNIQDIILSLIYSDLIEEGLVEQNVTVKFSTEVVEHLTDLYKSNQAHEFKVCLIGDYDRIYNIKKLVIPDTFSQNYNKVISEPCPSNTLIALHSHPYRHCIASRQDLKNLEKAKKSNPDALIGIMCEPGRFNFYS